MYGTCPVYPWYIGYRLYTGGINTWFDLVYTISVDKNNNWFTCRAQYPPRVLMRGYIYSIIDGSKLRVKLNNHNLVTYTNGKCK